MKRTFGALALLLSSVLILSCASSSRAAEPEETAPARPGSSTARPAPAPTEPEIEEDWPPAEEAPEDDFFSYFWPMGEEEPYVSEVPAGDIILEGAQTHLVVWGDNLAKLARTYYGNKNGYYFPLIMLASRDVVSSPDEITPDTRLTIPDLQRNLDNPASRQRLKEYINEVANMYDRSSANRWDIETRDELRSLASSL